jgi:hypothetical protein
MWRSTFSEFRDYTNGIRDKLIIMQILLGTFREAKCLSIKYYFAVEGNVTFQDITRISKLLSHFTVLSKGIRPEPLNLSLKREKDNM